MSQVTLYLPAELLQKARACATAQDSSLSAWLAALVRQATTTEWPKSLVDLLTHGSADLVAPDDPPPEEVERLR